MSAKQTRLARQLLGLNQTEFAALLGWTSKRNIVNLERGDKEVTMQTALAIECLLRRKNKHGEFEMLAEIQKRLDAQKIELEIKFDNLSSGDIRTIVFGEDDIVQQYLRENDISEDDVDLESLRDLQHVMINSLQLQ